MVVLNLPKGRKAIEWVQDLVDDYIKKYECNPTRTFVQNQIYETLNCTTLIEVSFCLELSFEEAIEWACSESMDIVTFQRKTNVCPPDAFVNINTRSVCPICLEIGSFDMVHSRVCKCVYHKSCFKAAFQYSTSCPVCQMDLNPYEVVHEIFV